MRHFVSHFKLIESTAVFFSICSSNERFNMINLYAIYLKINVNEKEKSTAAIKAEERWASNEKKEQRSR